MDRDVLMHQMHVLSREGTERFQESYNRALDALERAPDGQWIAANHERFGELLRGHADALGLEQARETLSLTDGGPWIRNQLLKHLKKLNATLLDFYHLSEHVWDTAKACWGDGEEAKAWASKQLHDIKHLGGRPLLAAIEEAKKKLRSPGKQDALRLLRNYIVERW
ncbi:MAG: hypothetical protein V1790_05920, partial [Planctomycetota bacterium]